jgi:hypothetical protein
MRSKYGRSALPLRNHVRRSNSSIQFGSSKLMQNPSAEPASLIERMVAAGVKRIHGIVGDSLNGLTDSLRRQGKIEWIH